MLIHSLDADGLRDSDVALARMMRGTFRPCEPTRLVEDGDRIDAAGFSFLVMHTPGHTKGGVTFVCEQLSCAFTGDTVFYEGGGRTDFPGGNLKEEIRSVERVLTLPYDYVLYPGHGDPTTVAHEIENNPFLRYRSFPWFS